MISPRPLVDSSYVSSLMDIGENEILDLVEEGLLYPAWNISCVQAKRRELRILSAGLTYYCGTSRPLPADPEEVCADLLPPDAPLTTATLCRTLNCRSELVLQLVKAKALTMAPGEVLRRGRGGAPKLNRQIVIQFLVSRLV